MLRNAFPAPEPATPDGPPAPRRKIVIAIDGPAASGKSTLAKKVAAQMGYAYLDTGSLFRAVAAATLAQGGAPSRIEDVRQVLGIVKNLTAEMLADPALRSPEVSDAAAKVAALPEVREAIRDYQHAFAQNPPGGAPGIVIDGRDVGTVVFPDAEVKLYVTATPEERARRRLADLKDKHPELTFETVLQDINERDRRDTTRAFSPLHAADDACVVDTTGLTLAESQQKIIALIQSELAGAGNDNTRSRKKDAGPRP